MELRKKQSKFARLGEMVVRFRLITAVLFLILISVLLVYVNYPSGLIAVADLSAEWFHKSFTLNFKEWYLLHSSEAQGLLMFMTLAFLARWQFWENWRDVLVPFALMLLSPFLLQIFPHFMERLWIPGVSFLVLGIAGVVLKKRWTLWVLPLVLWLASVVIILNAIWLPQDRVINGEQVYGWLLSWSWLSASAFAFYTSITGELKEGRSKAGAIYARTVSELQFSGVFVLVGLIVSLIQGSDGSEIWVRSYWAWLFIFLGPVVVWPSILSFIPLDVLKAGKRKL
jgi:hypothetical protein